MSNGAPCNAIRVRVPCNWCPTPSAPIWVIQHLIRQYLKWQSNAHLCSSWQCGGNFSLILTIVSLPWVFCHVLSMNFSLGGGKNKKQKQTRHCDAYVHFLKLFFLSLLASSPPVPHVTCNPASNYSCMCMFSSFFLKREFTNAPLMIGSSQGQEMDRFLCDDCNHYM